MGELLWLVASPVVLLVGFVATVEFMKQVIR